MSVVVNQEFIDFDGQTVKSGTYENAKIERMGYSLDRRNWFWNITQTGTVIAVTLGYPSGCTQTKEETTND